MESLMFAVIGMVAVAPLTSAAIAQDGTEAPAPVADVGTTAEPMADSACELHVWPAAGLSLTRQRSGDNLQISGLGIFDTSGRSRIENNTAAVNTAGPATGSPLDPVVQLQVLREADLPALLGLPGYRPVYHDTALEKRTLRVQQGRYDTQSGAPCYADLVLSDVVYSREYANGQNVKAFVRFRDFGAAAAASRRYATWIQTDLEYDREKAEASEAEMNAELVAGLATNLRRFAELLKDRP